MATLRSKSRVMRRLRDRLPFFQGWALLSLVWLGVIEWLGRQFGSDLGDLVPSLALLGLILSLVLRHRSLGIPGVELGISKIRQGWRKVLEQESECGLDFRQLPLFPPKCPPLTLACFVFSIVVLTGCAFTAGSIPPFLREHVAPYFYVGYLVMITALWVALIGASISFLFITYAILHDHLVNRHLERHPRTRRPEILLTSGFVGAIVLGLLATPSWFPLALLLLLSAVTLVGSLWPGVPRVLIVWKSKRSPATFRLQLAHLYLFHFLTVLFGVASLIFLARPDLSIGAPNPSRPEMPVTETLALIFAWASTVSLILCSPSCIRELWFHLRHRRTQSSPPVLQVLNRVSPRLQRTVRKVMSRHGWTVRFGQKRSLGAPVEILLQETESPRPPFATSPGPLLPDTTSHWPLPLSLEDLRQDSVLNQLHRRNEVQKRRLLLRRLERMFKLTRRRDFDKGEGLWVGCQHWFIAGLFRDEAEEDFDDREDHFLSDRVGPAFSRLLEWPVRSHYRQMTEALKVDLLFIEDGVNFRSIKIVFRTLFEIYDVHGGKQIAEERFFQGIPKVRVIIEEIDLNKNELSTSGYSEPDYEDIGRARILHVFRDRGEEDEIQETPSPGDHKLLPQLV